MSDDRSSSPPTRASLKAWWRQFNVRQKGKKQLGDKEEVHGGMVFGVPLKDSLRYASVQISTANADGEMYVWGYIPVVVAKCGLYLKEKGTEVEGTFRVSGSNKRMKELQAIFENPPRYGKNIDWKKESYTTHDVASVFRRYLTMMPEPVILSSLYHEFRNVYQKQSKADDVIQEYKKLIRSMPRANQYLLLYVLDLLSVFARKSDKNLMPASNLALIFRPGILAHPDHDLVPAEHEVSLRVLEFLIDHQDWFMLDIPPPPRSGSLGSEMSPSSSEIPDGAAVKGDTDGEDDLMIVPSSEDEHGVEASRSGKKISEDKPLMGAVGGWKLISRRSKRGRDKNATKTREISRSKSNVDRRTVAPRHPGDLSPVQEKTSPGLAGAGGDVVLGTGKASVNRSRTLPSPKSPDESTVEEKDKDKTNVLKKGRKSRPISVGVGSKGTTKERDKNEKEGV